MQQSLDQICTNHIENLKNTNTVTMSKARFEAMCDNAQKTTLNRLKVYGMQNKDRDNIVMSLVIYKNLVKDVITNTYGSGDNVSFSGYELTAAITAPLGKLIDAANKTNSTEDADFLSIIYDDMFNNLIEHLYPEGEIEPFHFVETTLEELIYKEDESKNVKSKNNRSSFIDVIKEVNDVKEIYKKMQKQITVQSLADAQDKAAKDVKRIAFFKKKIIKEVNSDMFRQVFAAGLVTIMNGENFIEICKKIYMYEQGFHLKMFAIFPSTRKYMEEYIIAIQNNLFPPTKEILKKQTDVAKVLNRPVDKVLYNND